MATTELLSTMKIGARTGARIAPLLVVLLLGREAFAQVDLPTRQPAQGQQPPESPTRGRDRGKRGLDLPSHLPAKPPAGGSAAPAGGAGRDAGERIQSAPRVELGEAATFVLEQLERLDDPGHRLVDQAVQSLTVMGPPGLQAARSALRSERPAALVAAARTLFDAGRPEDRDLVLARLQEHLPREACGLLVEAVAALPADPATLAYLSRLLEHSQAPVRQAAYRELLERLDEPAVLEALAPRLESKQSDTRLRAVQLLERLGDGRALGLLLDVLGDTSARVAYRAAAALASDEDERIDAALVNRAFGRAWILRENAYAILALVEREDESVRPILQESQADPLLQGLESSDPFISGVCASALAGIGFRSTDVESTDWLDEEVAHALVRAVSGRVFHNDFTSLQGVAIRRLTLISGESFGSDGPAWVEWWSRASRWFTAHRASITVDPERIGTLRVEVAETGQAGTDSFALLGPEAIWKGGEGSLRVSETVYVTRSQAADLLAVMQREGMLGAERLPGRRGGDGLGARSLVLVFDGRSKAFHLGAGIEEPWFTAVTSAASRLRDRNRWQRYFIPGVHESSLELWLADSPWWEAEQDPEIRDRRLKDMVLAWLAAHSIGERERGLQELLRLTAAGAAEPQDFSRLLELLRDEVRAGPRARMLVELSLASARAAAGPSDGEVVTIPSELAEDLLDAYVATVGAGDELPISAVLAAAGPAFAREVARRPEAQLRRAAALLLGQAPTDVDIEVLSGLLKDPEPGVELVAVEALGRARVESARDELLLRARIAPVRVRAAALAAIGALGGEDVLDALVIGMTDPDPLVQSAAANGLADLGDPRAASLFVSLLGQGRAASVREPVRRGLIALGSAAHPELLRAIHGSSPAAQRGAALILSYQGVPQAASSLISILTEDPEDAEVAAELAVLTAIDQRGQPDPAGAWWQWWDLVVHDDSIAWLCAGLEREGVPSPVPDALRGRGTREGARFLVSILAGEFRMSAPLAERARRELERLLGVPVEVREGEPRAAAAERILEEIEEHWR